MNRKSLIEFEEKEGEKWSTISVLPPHIEVSTLGRIRIHMTSTDMKEVVPHRSGGYAFFNYEGESYAVHRLVAMAFLPEIKDSGVTGKAVVKHINGNKLDNRVENLEWISNVDNLLKGHAFGTDSRSKIYCPELDKVFGSLRSVAFILQFPQDIISRAIQERTCIAGLTFQYIERDNPLLDNHNVFYLTFDKMYELCLRADSRDQLNKLIEEELGEGISLTAI